MIYNMKSLTRTRSVGGSLIVTIPREVVEAQHLKKNEIVEIMVERPKLSYFGAARGIGSFTHDDELNTHD